MTVFDRIYRTNAWAGTESRSGPGSGRAATEAVTRDLVALVDELAVTSVLDAACGDGFWMPALPGYLGIDVSMEAIELARRRHRNRDYMVASVHNVDHAFDLVILRDAIQHLSLVEGIAALEAIRDSHSRWLLASTFVGGDNLVNIETGGSYSPDLTEPPFSLGQPERLIFDGYGYEDGTAVRDPRKHLGLWRL